MIKLKFLLLKIKKDFLATKRQNLHGIGEKRIEQFFLLLINTKLRIVKQIYIGSNIESRGGLIMIEGS